MNGRGKIWIVLLVVCVAAGCAGIAAYDAFGGRGQQTTDQSEAGTQTENMQAAEASPGLESPGAAQNFATEEMTYTTENGTVSVGSSGLFYIDEKNSQLYFLDPVSGKTSIACRKENCAHTPHAKNASTKCEANVYGQAFVIHQGDSLYLVSHPSKPKAADYVLSQETLTGSGRRVITKLRDTKDLQILGGQASGRYIMMYYQQTWETNARGKKKKLSRTKHGIVLYDKEKERSRVIPVDGIVIGTIIDVEGYLLQDDWIDICTLSYQNGYFPAAAQKLKGAKRKSYEKTHREIRLLRISLTDEEDTSDMTICSAPVELFQYCPGAACRIEMVKDEFYKYSKAARSKTEKSRDDDIIKLCCTDFFEEEPSENEYSARGIHTKADAENTVFYGTDGTYLYYGVRQAGKDTTRYYCLNQKDGTSKSLGTGKYTVVGVTKQYIYFCDAKSKEKKYTAVSGKAFRKGSKSKVWR